MPRTSGTSEQDALARRSRKRPNLSTRSLKPHCKPFTFRTADIDPAELEEEIRLHGIQETEETTVDGKMVSIMPLRHGHLAQLIACGFIRGVVTDQERSGAAAHQRSHEKDRRAHLSSGKERRKRRSRPTAWSSPSMP